MGGKKQEETPPADPLPFTRVAVAADKSGDVFQDISQASLMVLAPVIGRACVGVNKAFLRCRQVDEDPAVCVQEGIDVHKCVNRVYEDFKDQDAFVNYSQCLVDKSFFLDHCLKEKEAFNQFVQKTKYQHQ